MHNAGTPVQPTGVTGAGLVFVIIGSSIKAVPTTAGSQAANLSIWRGMGTAPSSSRITATFPNNATGCGMTVVGVSGVLTSGTSGANAVGQSTTSAVDSNHTLVLFAPSATSTANAWFTTMLNNILNHEDAINWPDLAGSTVSHGNPSRTMEPATTLVSSVDSVLWAHTVSTSKAGVLVEIVADNPAAGGGVVWSPYYNWYYRAVVLGL